MKTKLTKTETLANTNGANGTKVTSLPKPQPSLFDLDDLDNDDDIFSADFKKSGKARGDDYEEGTEDEDEPIAPRKEPRGKGRQAKLTKDAEDYAPEDDDVDMKNVKPDFIVPDDDEVMETNADRGRLC